jgi:hypothetical protein
MPPQASTTMRALTEKRRPLSVRTCTVRTLCPVDSVSMSTTFAYR